MVIKESQVKAIIQEEIQKMLEEGEIDEAFLDTIRDAGTSALRGISKRATELGGKLSSAADAREVEKQKRTGEKEFAEKRKQDQIFLNNFDSVIKSFDKSIADMYTSLDQLEKILKTKKTTREIDTDAGPRIETIPFPAKKEGGEIYNKIAAVTDSIKALEDKVKGSIGGSNEQQARSMLKLERKNK
jgi:hypothetical protein